MVNENGFCYGSIVPEEYMIFCKDQRNYTGFLLLPGDPLILSEITAKDKDRHGNLKKSFKEKLEIIAKVRLDENTQSMLIDSDFLQKKKGWTNLLLSTFNCGEIFGLIEGNPISLFFSLILKPDREYQPGDTIKEGDIVFLIQTKEEKKDDSDQEYLILFPNALFPSENKNVQIAGTISLQNEALEITQRMVNSLSKIEFSRILITIFKEGENVGFIKEHEMESMLSSSYPYFPRLGL